MIKIVIMYLCKFMKVETMQTTLSIITIVYNGKSHIIETMESIINQTYKHIEYIIIDGASNDGTKELIESKIKSIAYITKESIQDSSLESCINNKMQCNSIDSNHFRFYLEATHKDNPNFTFKFLSQKDNGIYDAMNKGIDLATGEWCNFMNCGDRFYNKDSIKNLFTEYTIYVGRGG